MANHPAIASLLAAEKTIAGSMSYLYLSNGQFLAVRIFYCQAMRQTAWSLHDGHTEAQG
ncbi:MAG: hypothetical protein INF97_16235 [Roseomonas sp.]|nr:hypothetical protein [Roseomonas sp.]